MAEQAGFDSCLFSEHHQQADGYLPNPLLARGPRGRRDAAASCGNLCPPPPALSPHARRRGRGGRRRRHGRPLDPRSRSRLPAAGLRRLRGAVRGADWSLRGGHRHPAPSLERRALLVRGAPFPDRQRPGHSPAGSATVPADLDGSMDSAGLPPRGADRRRVAYRPPAEPARDPALRRHLSEGGREAGAHSVGGADARRVGGSDDEWRRERRATRSCTRTASTSGTERTPRTIRTSRACSPKRNGRSSAP